MDEFPLPLRLFNAQGDELYANEAFRQLIGGSAAYTEDGVPNQNHNATCPFYQDFLEHRTRSSRFIRTQELPGFDSEKGKESFVQETLFPHYTKRKSFTGFMSVLQFIHSQHRSTVQDQLSNGLFRKAFEQSSLPIFIGTTNRQLLYVNEAAIDLLGYTFEELEKILPRGIFSPGEFEPNQEIIQGGSEGEKAPGRVQCRLLKKSGEEFYANLTLSFVKTDDGQPIFRILQIQDVNEEVGSAQELSQALQRQKDESAIKDKLLRVVGHDIKNNINGIQGMLHLDWR
jgi:PAS domain S-box-containing protein